MKIRKSAIAAIACFGMTNSALAECVTPREASVLKTAVLQQQLMVAAFTCHDAPAYNRFVIAYRDELQRSDGALKAYFIRQRGGRGEAVYDTYKTRAANRWALAQARDTAGFCEATDALFDQAFATRSSLEVFVATAPPAPDFAGICIRPEFDNRPTLHVAQEAPGR